MKRLCTFSLAAFSFFILHPSFAESAALTPLAPTSLPDAAPSVLRVLGAFVLVIAIFLGGVWLFRNGQRLTLQRGRAPKLNVFETRSLGGRQALYVVGYEQSRFLIAATPAGVNLLSHLPDAGAEESAAAEKTPPPFSLALAQLLKGK
jgi:flagellar biogenesis protein FliO